MFKVNIWEQIVQHLTDAEFEVYAIGQKQGECKKPYIVVKEDGATVTIVSSTVKTYTLLCYVPSNRYSELEPFVNEVKEVMKDMFPLMRSNGSETPAFIESEIKAVMISIQYNNYRRTESRRRV